MGLSDGIRNFLSRGPDAIDSDPNQSPIQAQTQNLIEKLGFDKEVVDRFGDQLGTRKRRFSDFARDAAIGFIENDSGAPGRLHQQVTENVAAAVLEQREATERAEAERRERNQEALDIMALAREHQSQGGDGAKALMTLSKQLDIPIVPSMAALLVDEKQIPNEALSDLAEEFGLPGGGDLTELLSNPKALISKVIQIGDLKKQQLAAAMTQAELRGQQLKNEERARELGDSASLSPYQREFGRQLDTITDSAEFRRGEINVREARQAARRLTLEKGFRPDVGDSDQDEGVREAVVGPQTANDLGLSQSPGPGGLGLKQTRSVSSSTIGTNTTTASTLGSRGLKQTQAAGLQVGRFSVQEVR